MQPGIEGLLSAAAVLESNLRRLGWKFCFIGGVAVQRWGLPRFTQDLDLTLLTGFGHEERFIDELLTQTQPRHPVARQFALEHRVLLLRTFEGIDVDVALGAFPFEERSIERATLWKPQDSVALTTCSAEDLIIHKVFAGRNIDWGDVEQILVRQFKNLDFVLIESELKPLLELKGEMESLQKLEGLISTVRRRLESSF